MLEGVEKLMVAGLGAVTMTREKAEHVFDECVKRGKADKENRSKFVKDMVEAADTARKDMEKMVSQQVNKALEGLNLPTKDEITKLEKKIDKLLKRK